MGGSKAVTLRDVAAVSGVSVSTVSKALNGRGSFSAATHAKIQDAVTRLGFQPDALARSFATGRSDVIGMLTQFAPGAFSSPVMTGANTAFGQQDKAVLFADARYDSSALFSLSRKLRARRVDAVLVVGDGLHRRMPSITAGLDAPVVYAFGLSDDDRDTSFIPDNELAGRLATSHLVDIGRRRIAHIGVPDDLDAVARLAGCQQVLAERGLQLVGNQVFGTGWRRSNGAEAARELLESGLEVDAVFCVNDQTAIGCFAALRAAGRSVPDDVALVGVDNWEGMVGTQEHWLTTVETDLRGLGRAAAEHLLGTLSGERQRAGVHHHPGRLVPGETTLGRSGAEGLAAGEPAAGLAGWVGAHDR